MLVGKMTNRTLWLAHEDHRRGEEEQGYSQYRHSGRHASELSS
jgi:hypothetical protein